MQDFAGVQIANSCDESLIEQSHFDLATGIAKSFSPLIDRQHQGIGGEPLPVLDDTLDQPGQAVAATICTRRVVLLDNDDPRPGERCAQCVGVGRNHCLARVQRVEFAQGLLGRRPRTRRRDDLPGRVLAGKVSRDELRIDEVIDGFIDVDSPEDAAMEADSDDVPPDEGDMDDEDEDTDVEETVLDPEVQTHVTVRRRIALLPVIAAVLVFAGCGGRFELPTERPCKALNGTSHTKPYCQPFASSGVRPQTLAACALT